jgi:hypothetical protein
MTKSLLTLVLIVTLGFVSAADAKTIKLPNDDDAVASINIPDDWGPEEIENGIAANSPDEAVFLAIVVVESEKGMNAEIDDTFAMLKEHKVELDTDSKKENKFKINGLDAEELLYQGRDQDGPTAVSITFIPVKDKLIVLTYWVSTEDEKANAPAVGKIINSLKASS